MQSQLSYNDTDNPYINDLENWAGKSHQEIYSGAQSLLPGMLQTHATHWNDIAANLGGGLFGSNLAVQNALAEGAKGRIANAAADAAQKFFQQMTQLQDVITAVSARIRSVADGAQAVKLSVPPPSNAAAVPTPTSPGVAQVGALIGVTTPNNVMTAGRSEDELHQTAIAAMKNNYDPVFAPAGTGVPTFVSITKPGSNNDQNPSGPASSGPSANANSASNNAQNADNSQQNNSQQKDSSNSDQSQQSPSSANQGTSNSNTSPQSADSSSLNPSTSTGTAGYNGGMGSGGGGGLGGLDSGTAGGGSGGAGQSIPGTGSGNAAAAAASANGAAKATSSGTSGMPGMGGAGARKSEDEEREHKTPDYLIMDREEELIGRIDAASGDAIGANFPAAQTQRDNGEGNYR
ncbi:hypothetical protein [Nocardia vaccinii]|uniref:hypothetical protein n=1 Tax=Nocardia vaccinii TaxID=1822 RepID=UPI00082BB09A|nr:hypothetical protein [Nocardia vaccinii]